MRARLRTWLCGLLRGHVREVVHVDKPERIGNVVVVQVHLKCVRCGG